MSERNHPGAGPGDEPESTLPPDEEAAWAAIVAGYGEEPDAGAAADAGTEAGGDAGREAEADAGADAAAGSGVDSDADTGSREPDGDTLTRPDEQSRDTDTGPDAPAGPGEPPVRSVTVYAAGTGPRDWEAEEDEDEGHFVPPDPPLPESDPTTTFAWIALIGGPLLLISGAIFSFEMTWWIITLGVGGFLGGFGTLVARMRDDDDDGFDDPTRGAVV